MDNGQAGNDPNAAPWWMRTLARTLGSIGSAVMTVFGLVRVFTSLLSPKCIVSGVLFTIVGFCICMIEAPWCCQFVKCIQPWANFWEKKPYWLKAGSYLILPCIPVFICTDSILTSILFSLGVFVCGMLYGMMALGKKGDRTQMLNAAYNDNDPFANQDSLQKNNP